MSIRVFWLLALAGIAVFHLAAWVLPLFAVFRESAVIPSGALAVAVRDALPVAGATLMQSGLSTVLSLGFGGVLTWALRGWLLAPIGRGGVLLQFLGFSFALPTMVAGLAALSWIGARGWVTGVLWPESWAYSLAAVIAVHVGLNAPWIALRLLPAIAEIPVSWSEAAASLGAGPVTRFRKILLPALAPTILHAAVQVFCLCATSFALVLMLGGGPPVETLETLIYSRIRQGELDAVGAVAASLLQFALLLAPAIALALLEFRSFSHAPLIEAEAPMAEAGGSRSAPAYLLAFSVGVLPWVAGILGPLASGAHADDSLLVLPEFVSHFLDSLAVALPTAIGTVVFAFATVMLSRVRSLPGSLRRVTLLLGVVPSGLSVLLISLGFWRFWSELVDPFAGSVPALIAVQSVLFLPLTIRVLAPVAARTPVRLLEAAATLGASPLQAWLRIEAPRWRNPLATALLLVFSASLGEVAALSFFAGEGFSPVPLWLRELSARYEFGGARMVGMLLMGMVLGLGWIAARLAATGDAFSSSVLSKRSLVK